MSDSHITLYGHGPQAQAQSFVGEDAVELFRAITLRSALKLWISTSGRVIPSRGWTLSKMLHAATGYSHKPYKRSSAGAQAAMADLTLWIDAMRAALPVIQS